MERLKPINDFIFKKILGKRVMSLCSFHLWEDEQKDYMLTDLVEIHFVELPKFRKIQDKNYKDNPLQRWLAFL